MTDLQLISTKAYHHGGTQALVPTPITEMPSGKTQLLIGMWVSGCSTQHFGIVRRADPLGNNQSAWYLDHKCC